jgi:hypothetical protein
MPIILKGATSGQVTLDTPAIAGTNTITLPANTGTMQLLRLETAQNTTSGTSIDFLNIPSWAKKITVMFNGVSTNGSSFIIVTLGTSSGVETTNYFSYRLGITTTPAAYATNTTVGIFCGGGGASSDTRGSITITTLSNNNWVWHGACYDGTGNGTCFMGSKTLSGTLDRVRLTTVNGTDTFDNGSVNILIEGN